MKTVLGCINYCHSNKIAHRDLKPENILLEKNKDFHDLKVIDFGTSIKFDQSKKFKDQVGTAYYIAPQVLDLNYTEKCDIWSCGVICYILLTGIPPFNGYTDEEIMARVKMGKFNFDQDIWKSISDDAKDFITQSLVFDEAKRPSAEEILKHKWLLQEGDDYQVDAETGKKYLTNMRNFWADTKLAKATYAFLAAQVVT